MKTAGIVLIVIAIICFGIGLYKYTVYESYDSKYYDSKNAYVGGDAYNYIINANYFTGWSVLGACFFISGTILFGLKCLIDELPNLKQTQKVVVRNITESPRQDSKESSEDDTSSSKSVGVARERGWSCPICFKRNSADLKICPKCGTPRP